MVCKMAWIPGKGTYTVDASNNPLDPTIGSVDLHGVSPPDLSDSEKAIPNATTNLDASVTDFLDVACLANLAHVAEGESGWTARGNPTEVAIQVLACRFGYRREQLVNKVDPVWEEVLEFPFSSEEKKMSMVMRNVSTNQSHVFTKGAVERVLESCRPERETNSYEEFQAAVLRNMESMASRGLRVLALASRVLRETEASDKGSLKRSQVETDLTFLGLVGLYDPPRPESAPSVRQCHEAGISVHMLTGDHPGTAKAIAQEVGILPPRMEDFSKETVDAMVLTAAQFDKLSDEKIDALPTLPLVIARCAPNTKVRMIEALHRRKRFAAMVCRSFGLTRETC